MPGHAVDALIIGAGIAGCSLALELAGAGMSVVVLERRHVGGGSSSLNAGGVRQQFSQEINVRVASRTLERIAGFRDEHGEDIAFRRCGYLLLHSSKEEEELLRAAVEVQNRWDVPSRPVTEHDVLELVPGARVDELRGGFFCPTDGYLDPRATVTAFGRAAKRAGAQFISAEVTGFETSESHARAVAAGDREFSAGVIVNAAGAWAPAISRLYGGELPIQPMRSEILVLDQALVEGRLTPMVLDYPLGLAFHTEGRGLLVSAGVTSALDEAPPTVSPRPDLFLHVSERLKERLPETAHFGAAHSWAGLIEVTPDNNPILGWTHLDNVFTMAGFSGHGMCLAPGLAREAARLLRGEEPTLPIEAYGYARFESPQPLQVERLWSGARAHSRRLGTT